MIGALMVTLAVHAYLHARLIRDTELGSAWRRRGLVALVALGALLPIGMGCLLLMHDLPRKLATPLLGAAFTWVGALLFLLPLLLVAEPARSFGPPRPERRRALAKIIATVSGIATLGLGGVSMVVARLPHVVRRLRIKVPGLSRSVRIVQLSDLHVGATLGRELVEALVASVNALEPDIVAITGDLVDGSVAMLSPLLAPLASLRARQRVYFVTGNHEYLSGVDEWVAWLPTVGVRVLRNEHVRVGEVDLVGVDDPAEDATNLVAALDGRDRSRPAVLLAHRPDGVHEAAEHGIALQLSGHTHGGQIAPLGWALERLHQPYIYGLHAVGSTWLYVTSGAGFWGPPMRLATRAEIVAFDLVS
jgi:predicted MPP superfamily phosphohydrolase